MTAPKDAPDSAAGALPSILTHYYRDEPLRTLSDLDEAGAIAVLSAISARRDPDFRLTREEYLPRRRAIESIMRRAFIDKGGRPQRANPHYFILGTFSLWEDDAAMHALQMPLDAFSPDVVSFTYTDSYFAYSETNLRGITIPARPYHKQVFRLEELPALVSQYGLPGNRWRDEPDRIFDVYIEAQVWHDEPLRAYAKEST
jgi:hypothetical protein